MADRNINEAIRKPRKTKGTPFYKIRNIWAACVLAAGGFTWFLYELWPQTHKLKKDLKEGKLNDSPAVQHFFYSRELARLQPSLAGALSELDRRYAEKSEGPQVEPWYAKYFKQPEI